VLLLRPPTALAVNEHLSLDPTPIPPSFRNSPPQSIPDPTALSTAQLSTAPARFPPPKMAGTRNYDFLVSLPMRRMPFVCDRSR
jgi:hypothetical protein